jgi:hypothetical protein
VNPWLIAALVAVLLVMTAVLLTPMALHAMQGFLQVLAPHASNCPGTPVPC